MADDAKEQQIPMSMIGVGVAMYAASAFMHTGTSGIGPTILLVLIGAALQTGILIGAAFAVAAVLNISFGDARSAMLKFAGITLFSGGLAALIPFGGWIALFIFLGCVMWLFELEMIYAIALTVAYLFVSFGVVLLLRSMVR